MKTDDYPVAIDGKKYHIDRTFSGSPAIYVFKDGQFRHTNNLYSTGHEAQFIKPRNGDTIIMATYQKLVKGD